MSLFRRLDAPAVNLSTLWLVLNSKQEIQGTRRLVWQLDQGNEFLSVADIAQRWNCSPDTVTRKFEHEPGVIDISSTPNTTARGRRYRVLRIPRHVLQKVEQKSRVA
jgi:hypothetical protein